MIGNMDEWSTLPNHLNLDVQTTIEREGQPYVDRAVFIRGKPKNAAVNLKPIVASVANAFGSQTRSDVIVKVPNFFQRTRLRWMKPDNKGGMVPR